jgi:hypothetical protein
MVDVNWGKLTPSKTGVTFTALGGNVVGTKVTLLVLVVKLETALPL